MSSINYEMAELDRATVRPGVVHGTVKNLELTDDSVCINMSLPNGEKLSFDMDRPKRYWSDDIDFVKFLDWYGYSSSNLSELEGQLVSIKLDGDEPAIIPPTIRASKEWLFELSDPAIFIWSIVGASALSSIIIYSLTATDAAVTFSVFSALFSGVVGAIGFFLSLGIIMGTVLKLQGRINQPEITPVKKVAFDQEKITSWSEVETELSA